MRVAPKWLTAVTYDLLTRRQREPLAITRSGWGLNQGGKILCWEKWIGIHAVFLRLFDVISGRN